MRARHRPRGRIQHIAEAAVLGLVSPAPPLVNASARRRNRNLSTRAPLQHDHRQPRLLLELRVRKMVGAVQRLGVDLPEHTAPRVLGQLLESLELQRSDANGH